MHKLVDNEKRISEMLESIREILGSIGYYSKDIAVALNNAERLGADIDDPEGNRYIQLSDTLANQMIIHLKNFDRMQKRSIELLEKIIGENEK